MAGFRFWEWESSDEHDARETQTFLDLATNFLNQEAAERVYEVGSSLWDMARGGAEMASGAAESAMDFGASTASRLLTPQGQTPPADPYAALPGQFEQYVQREQQARQAPFGMNAGMLGAISPHLANAATALDVGQDYPVISSPIGESVVQGARELGVPGHETAGFKVGPIEVGPAEVLGLAGDLLTPGAGLPARAGKVGQFADDAIEAARPFAAEVAARGGQVADPFSVESIVRVVRPSPDQVKAIARHVLAQTKANDGETYSLLRGLEGDDITTGSLGGKVDAYAVSAYPDRSRFFEGRRPTQKEAEEYIRENLDLLRDGRNTLGTWVKRDENNPKTIIGTYLDVSSPLKDRQMAERGGATYNQEAIYGLKAFDEVPTGGTGDPLPAEQLAPLDRRLEAIDPGTADVARVARGDTDWWAREYGLSDAIDQADRVTEIDGRQVAVGPRALEQALRDSAARSSDGLAHLTSEELRPFMTPSSGSMREGANALNAGEAIGVPTSLDDQRRMTQFGLQKGWGRWYEEWGNDIATMHEGINPQEASFLFARFSSQLSPEQAKIASMAASIAARENNGFQGMAGADVQTAIYDVMERVGARKPQISAADAEGIASLYVQGFREMSDKAWKTATFQGNLGQGRRPWTPDMNYTGDMQAQRFFGYRAWHAPKELERQAAELKATTGKDAPVAIDYQGRLMTDDGAWQYMGTMGRWLGKELGAAPLEAQAAQWVVGQRAVLPTGWVTPKGAIQWNNEQLREFIRLNPNAPVLTDPAMLGRWSEIAQEIKAGRANVGTHFDELRQLGIYDLNDPAALHNVNQTPSVTGLAAEWKRLGLQTSDYPGAPKQLGEGRATAGPGLIYESKPERPWMKGSVRAITENPLAARALEEAPVIHSEHFSLGNPRHITDWSVPNSVVDIGFANRSGIKLPTLSPQLGRRVAEDVANTTGQPVVVFREALLNEAASGVQWTVDRRSVPSLSPQTAAKVYDTLGDDPDVVVAWDGRLLQVYMHPDATDAMGVARKVNSALRDAGITAPPKAKGYVYDHVRPRRAESADGAGVRPADGLGAGGGGDAGVLRQALERVLGRDVGRQRNAAQLARRAAAADAVNRSRLQGRPVDDAFVSREQALSSGVGVDIPDDPEFLAALQKSGGRVTAEGIDASVIRFQKPEQAGEPSLRDSTFYSMVGSSNADQYRGGVGHGGPQEIAGDTLFRRPLPVRAKRPGALGTAVLKQLVGRDAPDDIDEMLDIWSSGGVKPSRERMVSSIRAALERFGGNPNVAEAIVDAGAGDNIDRIGWAVRENIAAAALRKNGYDSAIGYGFTDEGITEILDAREVRYPKPGEPAALHPSFEPGKRDYADAAMARAAAADRANPHLGGQPYDDAMAIFGGLRGAPPVSYPRGTAASKLQGAIQWEPEKPTRGGLRDGATALIRQLFDNTVDLRHIAQNYQKLTGRPLSIQEDAWKLMRLARGSEAAAEQFRVDYLRPAVEGLDDQGLHDLNMVLKAYDAIDKQAASPRHNFSGIDATDAQAALSEIQSRVGAQQWTDLMGRAQKVWDMGHRLLQYKARHGLVDAQQAADLIRDFPHYSPIRIVDWLMDQAEGAGGAGASSLSVRANGQRHLTDLGTDRKSLPPLDAFVTAISNAHAIGARNDAGRALIRYFANDPDLAALVRPANTEAAAFVGSLRGATIGKRAPGETTFSVYEGGQQLEFFVDKQLKQALEIAGPSLFDQGNPLFQLAFGLPARMLRAGATGANILFMLPNAVGDAATYLVRGGGLPSLPQNAYYLAKGYKSSFLKDDAYKAMLRSGGGQSGFFGNEGAVKPQTLKGYAGRISTSDQLLGLVKDLATFQPVRELGQRFEEATRAAEFHRTRGKLGDQGAALAARDVTIDFARGGLLTKALNGLIPFFNVGFQAPAQVVRALKDQETRGKALVGVTTMVVAPTVALEVYNRQYGERYADVPQYVKDQGLVIMHPNQPDEVDPETGRPIPRYSVLKMREWSPFAVATREAVSRMVGDDPRTWGEFAQAILKNASPIEPSTNAIGDVLPTLPKVATELTTNHDFFRDRPIVPDSMKNLPPEEQYTSQTSEVAKLAGKALGASPMKLEHGFTGLTAGVGRQALAAGDLALKAAGATEEPHRRVAAIDKELALTGLNPEKKEKLTRERERLVAAHQNRQSLVREKPIVGGFAQASGLIREQGGELERKASLENTEAIKDAKATPLGAELDRLGMELPDVKPQVEGVYLDRKRAETYRKRATAYRSELLSALIETPTYQSATDTEKARLARGAMTRAANWAAQTVAPGEVKGGREFLSARIGGDIDKAIPTYLRAIEGDQELRGLRSSRFLGTNPDDVDQLVDDQSALSRFRTALGKQQGDMLFIQRFGAQRYARLQMLVTNPLYEFQVKSTRMQFPEHTVIFNPDLADDV